MAITTEQAQAILKPILVTYGEYIAKAKLDDLVALYSVDSVLIHKGKSCSFGRDQIKKALEPFAVPSETKITDEIFEATSDHIVYKAVFHTKITSNGAEFGGKFEQIYRKEGDSWLIIYDEFQS